MLHFDFMLQTYFLVSNIISLNESPKLNSYDK